MSVYNYKLENFISTPTLDDKTIKIFDQYGTLKYSFDPNLSYFYYKENFVFIKVENSDDITLDFETNSIATSALEKLNKAKKKIVEQATSDIAYYTKTELNAGQLNNIYYTSAQTNILFDNLDDVFSLSGHSHYVTGLTDVSVSGLKTGEVLTFNGNEWVNSSFTFDTSAFTSNYYTIDQLSSDTSGVYVNWNNIIEMPTSLSGYGISEDDFDDRYYTKGELSGATSAEGDGVLDDRYYTKIVSDARYYQQDEIDVNFLSANTSYYTQDQVDAIFLSSITSFYTQDQTDANFLSASTTLYTQSQAESSFLSANTNYFTQQEIIDNFLSANTSFYTQTEIDNKLSGYSDSGLTIDFNSHTATTNEDHQIGFFDLTTTAHTHIGEYYTQGELSGATSAEGDGVLDDRYYTKIVADAKFSIKSESLTSGETLSLLEEYYTSGETDALLNNYYTSVEINNNFLSKNEIDNNFLSANTEVLGMSDVVDNFLSASTIVLTQSETDALYVKLSGSNNITGDLMPATDGGASLGSASKQWKELFVSGGTIYIDGAAVSVQNGKLLVDGQPLATTGETASNYSLTSHTHDDRYYTKGELSGATSAEGDGVLDNRYYTKIVSDGKFYDKSSLYTSGETVTLLNNYYTSGETDALLNNYYTIGETNNNFLSANTTLYTQSQAESSFLSANTEIYTKDETNNNFLSASTPIYTKIESEANFLSANTEIYTKDETDNNFLSANTEIYTKSEAELSFLSANTFDSVINTNGIDNTGGLTSTTFYGELDYSYLTNTSHTHLWSEIVNTSHTHDDRYYTINQLSGGTLDNRYYTKIAADGKFYDQSSLYTQTEIDNLLDNYYTSSQTNNNFLSANTSFFTQDEVIDNFLSANTSYYTQNQANVNFISASTSVYSRSEAEASFLSANTSYYTQLEINNLLNGYSLFGDLTAHTSLTGSSNPHLISFNDLTTTSHTHDDRYYTINQFSGNTAYGDGVLDERYYTKILIDDMFSNNYYNSAQTLLLLEGYYTSGETDLLLDGKSDTGHTHTLSGLSDVLLSSLSDDNILAYSAATNTWYNTTLAGLSIDLSAYYTSAQTDLLLDGKSDTGHTHSQYSLTSHTHNFNDLTNTSHTHSWSDIYSTPTTLSGYGITDAYTKNELDPNPGTDNGSGVLDTRYYTRTVIDGAFVLTTYLTTNYYTSAQTVALFNNYYTSGETDSILLGYSKTGHSHYVSGLTDVTTTSLDFGDVLVYSGGTWVNSSVTADFSNYYTQTEIDNLLSGITGGTGVSSLISLTDTNITNPLPGEALYYNGSVWVNSAVTIDLSNYYTTAETAANFISANTTQFSNSAHSHYVSGLTDVISGWTVTDGQFLQYNSSLSGWTPADASGLSGNYVQLIGDVMTGSLGFDFMSGTSQRVLEVDSGGTVVEGDEVINLYITDSGLIDFITTGDTTYWSGRTFVNTGLSAFTIYEGQKYIDENYFYEYFDGILYRTYYANVDHTHDNYFTQWELSPTGLTVGVLDYRYMSIDTLSTMTLISLQDVYDMTPGTYDDNFLRYDSVSGWTGYYIDLDSIAYKNEVVLTGRTITGISGLTGGGTLDNDITIEHLTANTNVVSSSTPSPTTIVQGIDYDEFGHITSYQTSDFSSYWIRYIANAEDVDVTNISDFTEPYLYYNSSENKWIPTGLTIDRVIGLQSEIDNYVRKTGESTQSIDGDITIGNSLNVIDNLLVDGNTKTDGLVIESKIVKLNDGGSLNINDRIGFRFDRQSAPLSQKNDFYLVYDESPNFNISGGSIKAGVESDLKTLATTTNNPINGAVPFWYKPPGKFGYYENTNNLIWSSGSNTLFVNGDIDGDIYDISGHTYSGITSVREIVRALDESIWSSSSSSSTFTNSNPTPETIGGIDAGSTFLNQNMSQMWNQLLYPYQYPTFNSFTINGLSGTYEYGTYFSGTNRTFNWNTTNNSNISGSSISISGSEITTVNGLDNDGTELIYMSGFTGTTNLAWVITGKNTKNDTFNRNMTIQIKHKTYTASSGSSLSTDATEIRSFDDIWETNNFSYIIPSGNSYTAFYVEGAEKTISVKYVESSNAEMKTSFTATQVNVNDASGNPFVYHKYEQNIGGVGYTADATYVVTIS